MATLTRGKTFTANETVTNSKLHQLIDAGTVTAIVSADFTLTTTQPIHIGATAPSSSDHDFWYDSTNNIFKVRDESAVFQPVAEGQAYTNKSGGSIGAGDVVVLDTGNAQAVTTTTTATNTDVIGVALETIANDAVGIIATGGTFSVTVTGATAIGDYLFTSTTVKKADPSSTFSEGAFARALTSSSTSVVAIIFNGGAVQSVPGSATFEFESGTEAALATTPGTPTTVTFGTTFTDPPVVITTPVSSTAGKGAVVLDVTTTTFTVAGGSDQPFRWFACTAGTFEVISGTVIQAGGIATGNIATSRGEFPVYQTGKTPSIVVTSQNTDDAAFAGDNRYCVMGRSWGYSGSNLNFAGRNNQAGWDADAVANNQQANFVLVTQTSTVQTGNAATADGSQVTIASRLFEAGTVMTTTSATPALTFATAFSSAPMVLIGGEARAAGSTTNFAQLNAAPSTTAFTVRQSSTANTAGFNWFAIEAGHGSILTAKRLG